MGGKKETTWYRRLAEIPGIGYPGDLELHRSLPQARLTARIERYDFDDRKKEYLHWDTPEGSWSGSPAHALAFESFDGEKPAKTRNRVLTGLELPGTPSDYHFLIQGAHEHLWSVRREHPDQYPMIEWLCQLDLRLIEVEPSTLWAGDDAGSGFLQALAFDRLLGLYATEGFETEMVETARRISNLVGKTDILAEGRPHVRK